MILVLPRKPKYSSNKHRKISTVSRHVRKLLKTNKTSSYNNIEMKRQNINNLVLVGNCVRVICNVQLNPLISCLSSSTNSLGSLGRYERQASRDFSTTEKKYYKKIYKKTKESSKKNKVSAKLAPK